MGGQSLKYKARLAYHIAKAEARGKLKGEYEVKKLKPTSVTLDEYAQKILDGVDPLEVIAILGATLIIKKGIDFTEYVQASIRALPGTAKFPGVPQFIQRQFVGMPIDTKGLLTQEEILQWVLSFTIAYMVVHHFDELVKAGGSILGIAKGLIGSL